MKLMNYRSSIIVALIVGFLGFKALTRKTVGDPGDSREILILSSVLAIIDQGHYQTKQIDDNFSKAVFKTYIERMDGNKRYFTKSDLDAVKQYELLIDDQMKVKSLDFFEKINPLFEKRLAQSKTFYEEAILTKHDFNKKELIELDGEKLEFAKDEKELKERWRKMIKYEVLSRAFPRWETQNKPDYKDVKKTKEVLLNEAKDEVKKVFDGWFERLGRMRRSDRFESYVSTIGNYFDPHTDFFNPKEKADFDIGMSNKVSGIGARLSQDGDFVKVSEIVVGGPAWKGKELKVEDLITAITQKGGTKLDITGMRLDDVVQKIRGEKGTTVVLDLKSKDGSRKVVEIVREDVQLEEGNAKSVILDLSAELNNIGYIYLPKFYSSFESNGGNSCAEDVAKEIKKLKEEGVNGIVLDLRNNSGGSLSDVIDMTGLFIESGPIVQVKARESKPYVNKDKDPSVLYTGPLIVMVNQFSASASEILAAAVQDYGRGIVVGSTTFGKGTVQRFYELDRFVSGFDDMKPLGSLKMTTQKFFRINGGSTQHKGVVPDINFPDNYKYMDYGEKEYDFALDYSEIQPVPYKQEVVKIENLQSLKLASEARIKANAEFNLVEENARRIKKNKDLSSFPTSFDDYAAMMAQREKENEKFKNLFSKDVEGLRIKNLVIDQPNFDEEGAKARNEEWIKDLRRDAYLKETMMVMKDMIRGEKSFASYVKAIPSAPVKDSNKP
jgi:carboxyl-terminal processing protease